MKSMKLLASLFVVTLVGCGSSSQTGNSTPEPVTKAPEGNAVKEVNSVVVPENIAAIVSATDRSAEDKALDAGRKPAELLAFSGVQPGWNVAEVATGGGYTTELLARTVGETGHVIAQNNKMIDEKFAHDITAKRFATPANKNVTAVIREMETPLPEDTNNLDAVFSVLFYHDTVWLKSDRDKMNQAIFNALKPGGVYIVVDHSARAGTGTQDVETLHRIEESVVTDEVKKAGFQLIETASFLRNPQDARDWNDSPMSAGDKRGTSDRFVLKFQKPL